MRSSVRLIGLLLVLVAAAPALGAPAPPATTPTSDPARLKLPIYPGARYDARLTDGWRRVYMPVLREQAVLYAKSIGVTAAVTTPAIGVFVTSAGPEDVAAFYGKATGDELRINPFRYGDDLRRLVPYAPKELRPALEKAAKKYADLEGTAASGEKSLGRTDSAGVMLSNPGFDFLTGEPVRRTQIVLYTLRTVPAP